MIEERVVNLEARVRALEALHSALQPHLPPELRKEPEEPRPVQDDDETPKQFRERLAAWDKARRPAAVEIVAPVQGPDESPEAFRARVKAFETAHPDLAGTAQGHPRLGPSEYDERVENAPPSDVQESFVQPQQWR